MNTIKITDTDALLITDIQVDFLPGGALPVAEGDQIIPVLNNYAERFREAGAHIFASRDWHPANHISFKAQGGPWPPHCVQQTEGSKFHPALKLPKETSIISKATNALKEAYSVFDGTDFDEELKRRDVRRLFIGGLATDYCVLNTVLDARKLGYVAVVLMDATFGINVKPGDVERAVEAMMQNGAQQATSADFQETIDNLPTDEAEPDLLEEKPSARALVKKKARMRSMKSRSIIKREK